MTFIARYRIEILLALELLSINDKFRQLWTACAVRLQAGYSSIPLLFEDRSLG